MPAFNYKPLQSSRAIRLIRFLPGPKSTCQMVTVEVEKAPPYIALSYTWGTRDLTETISVNGVDVHITKNLAEAINAIYRYAWERNMMFWADSICINQADVHERGSQVRLMNTIYRSAEMVAIWLGPAADDSNFVFKKMREWKPRFEEYEPHATGSREMAIIPNNDPVFFGPEGSEQRRALDALRALCRRSWWERAWIVQEGVISSPETTVVFCGNSNIDWTYIRPALRLQQIHQIAEYHRCGATIDFLDNMAIRLDIFRREREEGMMISFLRVLRHIRAYKCEDPRDKVYAALGMAMDVYENDIVPDYTKPYPQICRDVAEFCMTSTIDPLDFLGYVWRSVDSDIAIEHRQDCFIPSWVSDWRFRGHVWPLQKSLHVNAYEESEEAYNATGSITGACIIDGMRLHLQGSTIDHITRVSTLCDKYLAQGALRTERSWTPENSDKLYFTGETILEAFNHTVTADIGRPNSEDMNNLSRGVAVDWELVEKDRNTMTAEERQKQRWLFNDVKKATYGRRFFETSRGFIGLGPPAAQIGDEVSVLLGGQVLYALRGRDDGTHEFIGECYMHGMMDGQACQDESFSVRDITLV